MNRRELAFKDLPVEVTKQAKVFTEDEIKDGIPKNIQYEAAQRLKNDRSLAKPVNMFEQQAKEWEESDRRKKIKEQNNENYDWKNDGKIAQAMYMTSNTEDFAQRGMTVGEKVVQNMSSMKATMGFGAATCGCLVYGIMNMENHKVSNMMMRGRVMFQGLALASALFYMDPLDLGRYVRPLLGVREKPIPSRDSLEYKDAFKKEWATGDPTRSIDEVRADMCKKMGWDVVPEWQRKYDEEMAKKFADMGDGVNKGVKSVDNNTGSCNISNQGLRLEDSNGSSKSANDGQIAAIVNEVMNESPRR